MTKIPVLFHLFFLSQSIRVSGAMHLEEVTIVQRLFDVINCHPNLAAIAEEKSSTFFIPNPPHYFGRVSNSHFAHANILPICFPFQRNLQQMFCIIIRIPLGIHAGDIQYTRVASRIALMSTSLLALERYLWYQILSLVSIFEINHVQSDNL